MFCCSTKKRIRNKRLKLNKIVPKKKDKYEIYDNVKKVNNDNDDHVFNNVKRRNAVHTIDISDEKIKCGGCNDFFDLGSNELKIHCNLCNQFFHCKIAGKCQGKNCMIKTNNIIHRASYCYDCVGLISDKKILCNDCFLDEHLDKNL